MTLQAHNFYDAASGEVNFPLWDAALGDHVRSFRDHNFQDAQVGMAFLTPQLHRIETQVYMTKYPEFDFDQLAYVNSEGGMWDVGSVFYSGDIAGKAEFFSAAAYDIPYADISRTQFLRENQLAAIGYQYNLQEMNRAAMLGRNLPNDKADAARKAAQRFCYGIFVSGNTEKNMTGLINDASVSAAASSLATWSISSDPDAMADAIFQVVDDVETNSSETEKATVLLLPPAKFRVAAKRRMTDGNETVLSYVRKTFREAHDYDLTIRTLRELATAGSGSSARMVAYANDREVVQFHLPGPHQFLQPQGPNALTYSIPGILNIAGTEIRRPKAFSYRDGI